MGLYKRNGIYWMNGSVNGRQVFESTKTRVKYVAEEIYAEWRFRLSQSSSCGVSPEYRNISFSAVIQMYLEDVAVKRNQPATYRRYCLSGKYLCEFFGNRPLAKITWDDILAYKKHRMGQFRIKPATVNRDLAFARIVFNWARNRKLALDNPVQGEMFEKEDNARQRVITEDEWQRILKELSDPGTEAMRLVFIFGRYTGARRSEIVSLMVKNLDFENRTVTFTKTKNGECRTVPLCETIYRELQGYLNAQKPDSEGPLFPGIAPDDVTEAFRRIVKHQGIKNATFHDFRRSFATFLCEQHVDIYHIARLTGHKTIGVLMKNYLRPKVDSLRYAVEKQDRAE